MQVHLFSPSLSGWKSHSMEQCFKENLSSISSLKGKRDDERKLRFQLKCAMNHNDMMHINASMIGMFFIQPNRCFVA